MPVFPGAAIFLAVQESNLLVDGLRMHWIQNEVERRTLREIEGAQVIRLRLHPQVAWGQETVAALLSASSTRRAFRLSSRPMEGRPV